MEQVQLVIFDFDGTLFDTQAAIHYCIKATFSSLLPNVQPPDELVHKLVASGKGLEDVLRNIHPDPASFCRDQWVSTYRHLYSEIGQHLVTPFDGAQELLKTLHGSGVPIAIISNKSTAAVIASLEHYDMTKLIPPEYIVGDTTPGATRKPDKGSYFNVLLPALRTKTHRRQIDIQSIFVVGDTEADLRFASNLGGAKSVWCRYGFGNKDKCESCQPDYIIDTLAELQQLLFGRAVPHCLPNSVED